MKKINKNCPSYILYEFSLRESQVDPTAHHNKFSLWVQFFSGSVSESLWEDLVCENIVYVLNTVGGRTCWKRCVLVLVSDSDCNMSIEALVRIESAKETAPSKEVLTWLLWEDITSLVNLCCATRLKCSSHKQKTSQSLIIGGIVEIYKHWWRTQAPGNCVEKSHCGDHSELQASC